MLPPHAAELVGRGSTEARPVGITPALVALGDTEKGAAAGPAAALFESHAWRVPLEIAQIGTDLPDVRIAHGTSPVMLRAVVENALGVLPGAVAELQILTEDGYESTGVGDIADAEALRDLLESHEGDCRVRAVLQDPALVTLWDGTEDCLLGRTDLRYLCPDYGSLMQRLDALLLARSMRGSSRGVTVSIDGREEAFNEEAYLKVYDAALAMADVVVTARYAAPDSPQGGSAAAAASASGADLLQASSSEPRDLLLAALAPSATLRPPPAEPAAAAAQVGGREEADSPALGLDPGPGSDMGGPPWRLSLQVADVGGDYDELEFTLETSAADLRASIGKALEIALESIVDVNFVTEGGFERISIGEVDSLADFVRDHAGDCDVEVVLERTAVATLWDGTGDNCLGRTDLLYLTPSVEAVAKRLEVLMPLRRYPVFCRGITLSVDGEESAFDQGSFAKAREAAADMADVVISAHYEIPASVQPPPLAAPTKVLGSPAHAGHTTLSAADLADAVRGVVWGAALGDSVGLAAEFMTKVEAKSHYPDPALLGPLTRVQDKHRQRWSPGDWTDDTDQMALLMDAIVRGGGLVDRMAFSASLSDWAANGFPELGDTSGLGMGETVNSVLEHPAFPVAPELAADVVWRQSGCRIAANGAVMRCAPCGFGYFWDDEVVTYNAAIGAMVTHADPRCVASCLVVSLLIASVLQGRDISAADGRQALASAAVEAALSSPALLAPLSAAAAAELRALALPQPGPAGHLRLMWGLAGTPELACVLRMMMGLEALRLDAKGTTGYTFKPVGAALWAFVHAVGFKEAVAAVTMEAGDADTNAVVVGAVLGARFGYLGSRGLAGGEGLPKDWLGDLPSAQVAWMEEKLGRCLRLLGLAEG